MPSHNLIADAPKDLFISISQSKGSGTEGLWGGMQLSQSSLGNQEASGEWGNSVCPNSPFSVCLFPSLSAALKPQGDNPCLKVPKGQFLRLVCAADSRPPATLSWTLEDRVLSWSRPSGHGGLELVLPEVKPGDAGHYACRAENRLGFQIRTLNVSVQCECD